MAIDFAIKPLLYCHFRILNAIGSSEFSDSEIFMCVLLNVYNFPGMNAFGGDFESTMISKITPTVEAVRNFNCNAT